MKRRDFLFAAAVSPLIMIAPDVMAAIAQIVPSASHAAAGTAGGSIPNWQRILVLVELKGGNDGLNTVIPYADPLYAQLRPKLGLQRDQVLQLSPQLGLHSSLQPLMQPWADGDLGIALGVGYPNPNRSHFRSIEIWETGSDANQYLDEGWVARLFSKNAPPADLAAEGIVVGQDDAGPLQGAGMRTITMQNPQQFIREAERVADLKKSNGNPALAHIIDVQHEMRSASRQLQSTITRAPQLHTSFPGHKFGQQMQTTAQLLASRTPVVVIKVSHTGFDTHSNQRNTQDRLLRELAEGLSAFRSEMKAQGLWNNILVSTYSEFGRRASENGSNGTDHGTAAPHILMGGKVKGGFYGQQPALGQLENGDLKYALDFRSMYATMARNWWGLKDSSFLDHNFKPLDCIA